MIASNPINILVRIHQPYPIKKIGSDVFPRKLASRREVSKLASFHPPVSRDLSYFSAAQFLLLALFVCLPVCLSVSFFLSLHRHNRLPSARRVERQFHDANDLGVDFSFFYLFFFPPLDEVVHDRGLEHPPHKGRLRPEEGYREWKRGEGATSGSWGRSHAGRRPASVFSAEVVAPGPGTTCPTWKERSHTTRPLSREKSNAFPVSMVYRWRKRTRGPSATGFNETLRRGQGSRAKFITGDWPLEAEPTGLLRADSRCFCFAARCSTCVQDIGPDAST